MMKVLARLLVWLIVLGLTVGSADAQRQRRVVLTNDGVAPSLDLNFLLYAGKTAIDPRVTFTRASVANYFDASGTLQQAASGAPRISFSILGAFLGLWIEESRTNVVLWNRDLTQAGSWTPTNITAALNQTGITGVSNSASSITATAGNGTILQAITLASSARFQSAYVKRLTGSGTIQMTMDNGATWTTVTVTSSWTQVTIPTQTLANPTVGFRIVTNGDAIAVDYVGNENGTFATSPILVTTVAATRAADVASISMGAFPFNAAQGTLVTNWISPNPNASGAALQDIGGFNDGTGTNALYSRIGSGAATLVAFSSNSLTGTATYPGTVTANALAKYGFTYNSKTLSSLLTANGAAPVTETISTFPVGLNTLVMSLARSGYPDAWLQRLRYYPFAMNAAQLRSATQ